MGCQTWSRTRASRVKAGDPFHWTIWHRAGRNAPTSRGDTSPPVEAIARSAACTVLPDLDSNQDLSGQSRGPSPLDDPAMSPPGDFFRPLGGVTRRPGARPRGARAPQVVCLEGLEPSRRRVRTALSASRDPDTQNRRPSRVRLEGLEPSLRRVKTASSATRDPGASRDLDVLTMKQSRLINTSVIAHVWDEITFDCLHRGAVVDLVTNPLRSDPTPQRNPGPSSRSVACRSTGPSRLGAAPEGRRQKCKKADSTAGWSRPLSRPPNLGRDFNPSSVPAPIALYHCASLLSQTSSRSRVAVANPDSPLHLRRRPRASRRCRCRCRSSRGRQGRRRRRKGTGSLDRYGRGRGS